MALANFLNKYKLEKGSKAVITHTSMVSGSYSIPDDELPKVLDVVYKQCVVGEREEYLVERQRDVAPIIIDMDFRLPVDCKKRMHDKAWIDDLTDIYLTNIKKIIKTDEPYDEPFKIFVMEKNYVTELTKEKDQTKDGIHIIITINSPRAQQMKLRELVMADSAELMARLPLQNSIDDVFDEALSNGNNGIVMFGCQKPEGRPYKLTQAYECHYDMTDGEPCKKDYPTTMTKETFMELCIRNTDNRTQFEFKPLALATPQKTQKVSIANTIVTKSTNTTDKWIELLRDVIRNDVINGNQWVVTWNNYHRIAKILKTNDYSVEDLIEWQKLAGDKYKDCHQQETRDLWDKIDINKKNNLRGLQTIAKEINKDGAYDQWLIKYDAYISVTVLDNGENDVGKFIAPQLQNELVFCNNHWYMFDINIGLWRIVSKPHSIIITHIQDRISESRRLMNKLQEQSKDEDEKKKLEDKITKYTKYYKEVGKGAFSSQIINVLTQLLYDGEFDLQLDTATYQVAYLNGILDLRTLKFREGLLASDYLTKTIPYNYIKSTDKDVAHIRKELLKICNNNVAHLEYYLSFLGYAMTGDSMKIQQFWYLRGQTASNGKSVIFDALTQIIPNYVTKLESDLFETDYGSRHKEVAMWRGTRIAWLNEVSSKKQDDKEVKGLADGTPVRYKVMYGGMSTMPISFKLFFVSNNTMNFKADNGVKRRLRMVQLDSEFVDGIEDDPINCRFKKDTTFGTLLLTQYKYALMDLLYSYSQKFAMEGELKPYPAEWNDAAEEVCADNNVMPARIDDMFDYSDVNAKMKRVDMDYQLSLLRLNVKAFKDVLVSMRIKSVKYDSQLQENKSKGWWIGIKLKEVEVVKDKKKEGTTETTEDATDEEDQEENI